MALPARLSNMTTREAITDTIYRMTEAADANDLSLLDSACVPDVTFVVNGHTLTGLDAVKSSSFVKVGPMDTTHFVTNIRIDVADEAATTAKATANALAQHYPPGMGTSGEERRLLAGSRYKCDVVKDEKDGLWKIKSFEFTTIWREGDRSVMA